MAKRNASKKSPKKSKRGGSKAKSDAGKQTPAFRTFSTEQRAHRQAELNSMSTAEQMKLFKGEWKKLSAKEKQAYQVKAPVNASHNAHDKKESSSQPSQSLNKIADPHQSATKKAAKPKRAAKRQSRAKGASKKKSHAKKTKRAGRKPANKKGAHHEEHADHQAHETVNNPYE